MQLNVASASVIAEKASDPLFRRIWPPAFIAFALALTAAWVLFLGYEIVSLIVS
ncbi:MAG: hypothetical protein Q8M24_11120 [Pseudolabrys sp.]|nr:hypothetical protein [Pseudolabrys sp.]MDP2295997.1 hypothetical protein [Pseudolabrys sp.]